MRRWLLSLAVCGGCASPGAVEPLPELGVEVTAGAVDAGVDAGASLPDAGASFPDAGHDCAGELGLQARAIAQASAAGEYALLLPARSSSPTFWSESGNEAVILEV